MKIAWVVRPTEGGILRHLKHLLTGLSSEYQISIIGPPSLQDNFSDQQFFPLQFNDGIHPLQDMRAIWRLSRLLRQQKPDLLHIHGLKAVMIAAPAARLGNCSKLVFTAHNNLPLPNSRWYKVSRSIVNRYLLSSLQRIITVSAGVRSEIIKMVPEHRVITIYNGVNCPNYPSDAFSAARQRMKLSETAIVIGVVARLIPEKGLYTLLEAASILKNIMPELKFVIVGDGPERKSLEKYRDALELQPIVCFLGYQEDVPQLMAGWNLFVLPSLNEGFSLSVLEAMAARLPVVVTDLPCMREMIVEGKGGIFVPPKDSPSLAAAILRIIKDQEKAKMMGDYNYFRVRNDFSVDKMVDGTRYVYNELLKKEY